MQENKDILKAVELATTDSELFSLAIRAMSETLDLMRSDQDRSYDFLIQCQGRLIERSLALFFGEEN